MQYLVFTLVKGGSESHVQLKLRCFECGIGWDQVRSEIAYLNHGMLVRHIIDESSPLYRRTAEMLRREDSIFALSVVSFQERLCFKF